jgi:anti-anti-sigma factor
MRAGFIRTSTMIFRHSTIRAKEENASVQLGDVTVQIDRSGLHPSVAVTGRVTVDSTPRFRSVLIGVLRENPRVLVIDLSRVSHLDTSGFAALLELLNYAREHSIRLRLVGINGQPGKLAQVAQLDQIFSALGSEVVLS